MIGIIDYGAGNVRSLSNALRSLAAEHVITSDRSQLAACSRLILPGVGEARTAVDGLKRIDVFDWLRDVTVPTLGICLGMQLFFEHTTERATDGLAIAQGIVERFRPGAHHKVPHMGWNRVESLRTHPLFERIMTGSYFYFVHSYYAPVTSDTIAVSIHDVQFASAVAQRNFIGVQFHPEKSGDAGFQVLNNFIQRC